MPASARAPLHLLMTADAVGGGWTYALDLARASRPGACETTLAVLGPRRTHRADAAHAGRSAGSSSSGRGLPLDWTARRAAEVDAAGAAIAALARGVGPTSST